MSTRREFIRHSALATAAAAAGLPLTGTGSNVVTEGDLTTLKWDKAPCRYCGTGCGVNVAVKDGRVVAPHGDVHAEVNRGINCVKGYFLSKILYGADRLAKPLLRKKNGVSSTQAPYQWRRAGSSPPSHNSQCNPDGGPGPTLRRYRFPPDSSSKASSAPGRRSTPNAGRPRWRRARLICSSRRAARRSAA